MVSGGIEPNGLSEYHLAGLSTVNFLSYSDCRFQSVDHRLCVFSRSILLRMTTTTRGTNPTGLPKYHLTEWSTDGVVLGTKSTLSSYNEHVGSAEWPDQLPFNLMKHDLQSNQWRDLTLSGYNHEGEVQPTSLLKGWFSSVKCRFSRCFFSTRMIL